MPTVSPSSEVRRARSAAPALRRSATTAAAPVRVSEHRRIWAGFGGRGPIGSAGSGVDLVLTATDRFSPGAGAGVLYPPGDTRIELGASVAWADTVQLGGDVSAASQELA